MKKYLPIWINCFMMIVLIGMGFPTPAVAQPQPLPPAVPAGPDTQPGAPGTAFRYVQTLGVSEVPYIGDLTHLNAPNGLITDPAGNVYVVEEQGARLLKYDSSGSNLWSIGQAGLHNWSNQNHDRFGWPREVARDSSGNLWVADNDHVASYDASGAFRLFFPAEPWNAPSENQFNTLRGVAFDSGGRLYLADSGNHRIQVYTIGLDDIPVFAASLGSQGSGLGQFNYPSQLAIDSTDNSLYVADVFNYRVQKCTPDGASWPWGWTCAIFHGGSQGSGANQLDRAFGLGMDAARSLFIADGGNGRVKKCTPAGSCTTLIQASNWWPADVAAPDSSTLLVTDYNNHVIKKYNASGVFQSILVGTAGIPYVTDLNHYNKPRALAVDPANNVYMVEEAGQRLFKFDPGGALLWSVGMAGVAGDPPDRLCWPEGVAVGPDTRVYLAGCSEVRIYTAGGVYFDRFPTPDNSWAAGVAVDPAGNIYVSDGNLNKVYIYNSNHNLVHTIGTGVYGSANDQFAAPRGLALDSASALYVADTDNCRVQKFDSSWQYLATFGQPGVCANSDSYSALSQTYDVAVDLQGRIYVADSGLNRVQVLDSSGKYLSTLGGAWDAGSGGLRYPTGVKVDRAGGVYVADTDNARIQKFALGVRAWQQANLNGFFSPKNRAVVALEPFGDSLYAGLADWDEGAMVMRSNDGTTWVPASNRNFGSADFMPVILDMIVFNGSLYVGTSWGENQVSAQLWRTQDGTNWLPVETRGFGIGTAETIGPFAVSAVSGTTYLYAAVNNSTDGFSIFRSASGDPGTWNLVVQGGVGVPSNTYIDGFTEFNGKLYIGVENHTLGGRVYSSDNGSDWIPVGPLGLGNANNLDVGAMAVFNGHLYAPTRNDVDGAQIYRLDAGPAWTLVIPGGFGNLNNIKVEGLYIHHGKMIANVKNDVDGMGLMATNDGITWKALIPPGFGTSNNGIAPWINGLADFKNTLFVGTWNNPNGGQIWRYLEKQIYLPIIKR